VVQARALLKTIFRAASQHKAEVGWQLICGGLQMGRVVGLVSVNFFRWCISHVADSCHRWLYTSLLW